MGTGHAANPRSKRGYKASVLIFVFMVGGKQEKGELGMVAVSATSDLLVSLFIQASRQVR